MSEARLTPRIMPGSVFSRSRIVVEPEPAAMDHRNDYFGNEVTRSPSSESRTSYRDGHQPGGCGSAGTGRRDPTGVGTGARLARRAAGRESVWQASEFVFDSPYVAASADLAEYARPSFAPGRPLLDAVRELSHRIHTSSCMRRNPPPSTCLCWTFCGTGAAYARISRMS